MAERAKKSLMDELNRVRTEIVPEREFVKVKNNFKYRYLTQLCGSNLSRALTLVDYYLREGRLPDPAFQLERLEKLTPYSILALARRQLKAEKFCFITILPGR